MTFSSARTTVVATGGVYMTRRVEEPSQHARATMDSRVRDVVSRAHTIQRRSNAVAGTVSVTLSEVRQSAFAAQRTVDEHALRCAKRDAWGEERVDLMNKVDRRAAATKGTVVMRASMRRASTNAVNMEVAVLTGSVPATQNTSARTARSSSVQMDVVAMERVMRNHTTATATVVGLVMDAVRKLSVRVTAVGMVDAWCQRAILLLMPTFPCAIVTVAIAVHHARRKCVSVVSTHSSARAMESVGMTGHARAVQGTTVSRAMTTTAPW